MRDLPLVTIDGEDARDFDDAVYAEPHKDGFRIWVAIADVIYVPQGSLNKEAEKRANGLSTRYGVPMLPEFCPMAGARSAPMKIAPAYVRMDSDENGHLKAYRFVRGLMRSHARLTYTRVQTWMEGQAHDIPEALVPHLTDLKAAYEALRAAGKRGTLDLDMPERWAVISEDRTQVLSIAERTMGLPIN